MCSAFNFSSLFYFVFFLVSTDPPLPSHVLVTFGCDLPLLGAFDSGIISGEVCFQRSSFLCIPFLFFLVSADLPLPSVVLVTLGCDLAVPGASFSDSVRPAMTHQDAACGA